jgi:hypothetical protein
MYDDFLLLCARVRAHDAPALHLMAPVGHLHTPAICSLLIHSAAGCICQCAEGETMTSSWLCPTSFNCLELPPTGLGIVRTAELMRAPMFTGLGLDCAVWYGSARMGRARARRRYLCCACARSQPSHPQYQSQPEHCACEHCPAYHAILRRHAAVPGLRSSSDMTNVASGFVLLRCEFRLPVAVCTPFRGLWPLFGPNGRWLGERQDYHVSSRSSLLKVQAAPHACWPSTTRRSTQELRLPVLCGPRTRGRIQCMKEATSTTAELLGKAQPSPHRSPGCHGLVSARSTGPSKFYAFAGRLPIASAARLSQV